MNKYWSINDALIDETAPDFEVATTQGPRKLSDYRGRWLILFSHPADFTPVCTTEFVAFARAYDKFQDLGCDLLGLSLDSNFAHLAWIRSIKENFGVDIPFPIVADVSKKVARAYGMIQDAASDVATVRSTFFIDPVGAIRAMLYYPLAAGRSVDEMLRLLAAMQTADQHGVVTPEGWQPGDKVIVPPPITSEEADERENAGDEYTDWYLSKRAL